MNLKRISVTTLAALAAISAFADIKWVSSYQSAIDQAKATNKIVMVEFYASWDISRQGAPNWCGRMEKETLADPKAVAAAAKFIPVRVAVDKEGKDLARKFHITNYPTILFLDKNQNDVGTIDGFEDVAEFTKHTAAFLKDFAEEPKLLARYKKSPKDLEAIAGLGVIQADRYHIEAALNKLHEAEAIDPQNKTGKVSDLYNAVADHYQNASKFDPAITYFKKAADTSKVTDKKAYAYLSIATCYFTMDAPADPQSVGEVNFAKVREHLQAALPYVDACLKLPNLKPDDLKLAQNYKENIQRALSGGD